jgi:hypothetical protein
MHPLEDHSMWALRVRPPPPRAFLLHPSSSRDHFPPLPPPYRDLRCPHS